MIIHNLDPVLIDFGFMQVRWYSLSYIFGVLGGWWYGKIIINKLLDSEKSKIYSKNFDDLIAYIIIGIILGGRIGYVIFYNPKFYLDNLFEIFKIWNGGMSFHGGLIGIILATIIFSIKKKLNYKLYFDAIACVAPIGIFFGRIANFINAELYGSPTQKSWGIIFPSVDGLPRHPSQLYEAALEGLALFIILNLIVFQKRTEKGLIGSLFLIFYGIFRIISEQFREPDAHLGYLFLNLSMGSILSALMIISGILFFYYIISNENN